MFASETPPAQEDAKKLFQYWTVSRGEVARPIQAVAVLSLGRTPIADGITDFQQQFFPGGRFGHCWRLLPEPVHALYNQKNAEGDDVNSARTPR